MRSLLYFLPLLGLVAAQMHGRLGAPARQNDPFFNDFGTGTGSRTPPPWAAPPRNAAPMGGGGVQNGQSSTKPPGHNPYPVGDPQVVNSNPNANANPNGKTGSGEMAGFGEADVFHAALDGNTGGAVGGAQPLPAGRSSGELANGGRGGLVPGLMAGGGFDANEMQKKSDANEVSSIASASTVVGVVVAVLIVIGIFALVAVFLVRQRRQSRVVIGSV